MSVAFAPISWTINDPASNIKLQGSWLMLSIKQYTIDTPLFTMTEYRYKLLNGSTSRADKRWSLIGSNGYTIEWWRHFHFRAILSGRCRMSTILRLPAGYAHATYFITNFHIRGSGCVYYRMCCSTLYYTSIWTLAQLVELLHSMCNTWPIGSLFNQVRNA
jgi:hypothetical protein